MINTCGNCETPEEDSECEKNLDELYKYSYNEIMSLIKEQEFKDKKGIILH